MEASDNGYFGVGGIQTASVAIQLAVVAVNDAPVVVAPFGGKAVPGETTPFPGFLIMDPDTDTDGMLMAGMLKVILSRQKLMFATMHAVLGASRRVGKGVYVYTQTMRSNTNNSRQVLDVLRDGPFAVFTSDRLLPSSSLVVMRPWQVRVRRSPVLFYHIIYNLSHKAIFAPQFHCN